MKFTRDSFLRGIHTAGSVADAAMLAQLGTMDVAALCDVVEFRADAWPDHLDAGAEAMRSCPVPVLLTVRAPEEGGMNGLDEARRRAILERLLPHAQLVDIELANLKPDSLLTKFRKRGLVVGSYHNFSHTPARGLLRRRMNAAAEKGADIVKFATVTPDLGSLNSLASLLTDPGRPVMSVMGMGALGRVSRLLCAQLGSTLNYGYLDRPTVPGQWPAAELRRLIREGSP